MTSSLPPSSMPPESIKSSGIKRLLVFVRQPMSIATIASVGIHGALLFLAPSLPQGQQAKAEGPKTVNVVQLTPEEQRRLPNFSKSIPALSNPLVAANPSLYNPNSLPGLPNPSSLPPLPPVGNPGTLSSFPDPNQLWGQVKPQTSFSIPAPQPGTNFPSVPNVPPQIQSPIPGQPNVLKPRPPVGPPPSNRAEQSPEPTPTPSPTPTLLSAAEVQRQREEAARQEAAARSNQPSGPPGYVRSIVGTTSQEQGQNLIALITPFAAAGQKYELKNVEENLIFPDAFCPKDTGKAVLSVVVNTADGVIQSTKILQKAGYAPLDQFSEAQAKAKTFAPNNKVAVEYPITIYTYTFTFVEPEGGCKSAPAATPTPSEASASPSPAASPATTPTSN
jgi:hypothetical protein